MIFVLLWLNCYRFRNRDGIMSRSRATTVWPFRLTECVQEVTKLILRHIKDHDFIRLPWEPQNCFHLVHVLDNFPVRAIRFMTWRHWYILWRTRPKPFTKACFYPALRTSDGRVVNRNTHDLNLGRVSINSLCTCLHPIPFILPKTLYYTHDYTHSIGYPLRAWIKCVLLCLMSMFTTIFVQIDMIDFSSPTPNYINEEICVTM